MKNEKLVKLEEIKLDDIEVVADANTPLVIGGVVCGFAICAGAACGGGCGGILCAS